MKKQIILGGLLAFSSIANAQWTGTGTTGNITRTGNVGIGSAVTPVNKLHVTTSVLNGGITVDQTTTGASALSLKNSTTGGRLFMLASTGINNTQGAGNFDIFDFGVGGTGSGVSRLFIQGSTGYIGIGGTSSPQNNLHINTSVLNGGITIDQTTTGASAITLKNSTTGGRTFMLASSGINNTQGAGNFDLFDFGVGGTGAGVSRLFIQGSTGNVGLGGISNPLNRLQVSTSTANDGLRVTQTGSGNGAFYLSNTISGGNTWTFRNTGTADPFGGGNLAINNGSSNLDLLYLKKSDQVGIGGFPINNTMRLWIQSGKEIGIQSDVSAFGGVIYTNYQSIIGNSVSNANTVGSSTGVRGTAVGAKSNYGVFGIATTDALASVASYGVYGTLQGTAKATDFAGYFNGPAGCISGLWTSSDKKLKDNIQVMTDALTKIKLLKPSTYTFKTNEFKGLNLPQGNQIGLIAQELEQIFPELVMEIPSRNELNEKGEIIVIPSYKSVNYTSLIPVLISGIQEQQKLIETQQKQLDEQKELINTLLTKTGNTTGVNQLNSGAEGFALDQNIPNPFSEETVIKYTLTQQTKTAVLNVYDLSGKQITSFPLTERGASSITVSSEKLAAGIYIYSVLADGKIMDSKRMVVAQK